jgi:cbb3-type cytochrome oxidase subunit 1
MSQTVARNFILASLAFLIIACLEGLVFPTKKMFGSFYSAMLSVPPDQIRPYMCDFFSRIHTHMSLVGWLSCSLMGVLYYLAPKIRGEENYVGWICRTNLWFQVVGLIVLCIGWHMVGSVGLSAGFQHGTPEFTQAVKPYKPIIFLGGGLLCVSAILFSYNIFRCLCLPAGKGTGAE